MIVNHLIISMQLNFNFCTEFPKVMLRVFSGLFLILLLLFCRKLLKITMGKLHILRGGIMMTSMNFSGLYFWSSLFSGFIVQLELIEYVL